MNKSRIWTNSTVSEWDPFHSLRKNNKPNLKNTIKPKLRKNPEFEQIQKSRIQWAPFASRSERTNQIQKAIKAKLASVDDEIV